jgi:hypothetical protein
MISSPPHSPSITLAEFFNTDNSSDTVAGFKEVFCEEEDD